MAEGRSLTGVLGRGRTSLDLYANVIHCQSLPGVETRHRDIDILIVRENTEGEYSSLEHEVGGARGHALPHHAPKSHAPCQGCLLHCPGCHASCSLATPPECCGPKLTGLRTLRLRCLGHAPWLMATPQ